MIRRKCNHGERGVALIVVLMGISLVLLMMLITLSGIERSGRAIGSQLTYQGQALNAAQAGLTEGQSFFIKQVPQPVITYNPQLDLAATPPKNDTEDPSIGIVRTYKVSDLGNVWGRYELRKWTVTPTDDTKVQDVSAKRGITTPGSTWQIESNGVIYVRADPGVAFDVAPNRVIARRTLRAEIRRLLIQPPANAAISTGPGVKATINAGGRVRGGIGIGVAYVTTKSPTISGGTLTGSPASNNTSATAFPLFSVFGVTQQELAAMADIKGNTEADLPNPLPNMSLIIVSGNATFSTSRPLTGSGILVVYGNLTISASSNSFWNGVIYCTGTVTIREPALISGTVISLGNATVQGGGDIADVNYDPAMITQIQQQMGQYRFSRTPYIPGS